MDEDKVLAALERLESGQHDLARNITDQFRRIDDRFEQVDKRFEQVDKRFEQVDKRFEQVDKHFEQVDRRFEQVDKHFEQVDRRFERFDQRLDQFRVVVMDRFEKMEDRLTSMLSDLTVNFGAVTHMSRRQDNDREEMRSLHNLVMTLVTKLHRIQTNVEELQKKAS